MVDFTYQRLDFRSFEVKSWSSLQSNIGPTNGVGKGLTLHHTIPTFNPFPNKPWFLRVYSTSLWKTLWEKEKLLITSNFSFSHSVFYLFRELLAIFIKLGIVICKLFQFGRVWNSSFGKGLTTLMKKALENNLGKVENAGNQYFILFPQYFLHYQIETLSF